MTIEAFIICNDKGQPLQFDEVPEDANNLGYGVRNTPVFQTQAEALAFLNSLPGTASFEGFEGGTVRKAMLTIGEVVADQDDPVEDDEDD